MLKEKVIKNQLKKLYITWLRSLEKYKDYDEELGVHQELKNRSSKSNDNNKIKLHDFS